ncbi:MAG: flagellar basal body-associated protein FliL [Sulfurimonas sp.]|uniref:flagellar basal body-associated protein FliL n=1 Tax=Sulfurimonas sp. TaxID=2022749 RepID=UPI0026332FD3|nr:flagellar basal body-associated protein FliL [Sulfurimonas sp.]MDD5372091.1 flagellar basal body-associated protein FliL [Sulfurimonas sp.]
MSEKETKEEVGAEKKKSGNTLMLVIIVVLLLIIIGGGLVAFLLLHGDEKDAAAHGTAPQAHEKAAPAPAAPVAHAAAPAKAKGDGDEIASRKLSEIGVLYPLDTFTVNLKSDSGRRYLKATVSLELKGPELSVELDKKTAVIRDRIIRILTSKTLEEISSAKGKQKVTEQIVEVLNSMLADGSVKGIYFTEFVIQ